MSESEFSEFKNFQDSAIPEILKILVQTRKKRAFFGIKIMDS
jgi:hypothetical protein